MIDSTVLRKTARTIAILAAAAALVTSTAAAQQQTSEQDLAQANNPLANFVAFNAQNY